MHKYMRLQLFLISKKVSTYLIPIIFGLAFFLSIGLIILITKPTSETISHSNAMMFILPFIISAIFVAVKALNIFKDSEDDGTELLIVSKPLTRVKIVMGKFFSLYTLIFLFSIFTFFVAFLVAQCDEHASMIHKLEFAGSVAFGTLVIQFLLSSLIVFFASVMGKIGTMVLSILLPLVFTIVSMILVPISHSSLTTGYGDGTGFSTNIVQKDSSGKLVSKNIHGYWQTNKGAESTYKTHEKSWYRYAAYGDIWTQLSSFYTVFQEDNKTTASTTKWRKTGNTPTMKSNLTLTLAGKKYALTYPHNPGTPQLDSIISTADKMLADKNFIDFVKNGLTTTQIDNWTVKSIIENYTFNKMTLDKQIERNETFKGYLAIMLMNKNIIDEKSFNNSTDSFRDMALKDSSTKIVELQSHPYIPKALLYAIWLGITFGVGGLVMLRYMRRDFK